MNDYNKEHVLLMRELHRLEWEYHYAKQKELIKEDILLLRKALQVMKVPNI